MSERVLTAIKAEHIKRKLNSILEKRSIKIVELTKYQYVFSNINMVATQKL